MQKNYLLLLVLFIFPLAIQAQGLMANGEEKKVSWKFSISATENNNEFKIVAAATILPTWHVFGQNPGDDFLIPTNFTFENKKIEIIKVVEEGELKTEEMEAVGKVSYYEKKVSFTAMIRSMEKEIAGFIEYQICNATMCLPPTVENFKFTLN